MLTNLLRKAQKMIRGEAKRLDPAMVDAMLDNWSPESIRETCELLGLDVKAAYREFLLTVTQAAWDDYKLRIDANHDPASGRPRKLLDAPMELWQLESIARQAHSQRKRPEEIYENFWTDAARRAGPDRDHVLTWLRMIVAGSATAIPPAPPAPPPMTADDIDRRIAAGREAVVAMRRRASQELAESRRLPPEPVAVE